MFVSTIEMIFIKMFVGAWLSGILGRSKSVVRLISARETIYEVVGHTNGIHEMSKNLIINVVNNKALC